MTRSASALVRAGALDRTITIERLTLTIDDAGTPVETWSSIATMRAELLANSALESATPDVQSISLRTRYRSSLTIGDRVIYEGVAFDIRSLTELGRRRGLDIRAEKVGS